MKQDHNRKNNTRLVCTLAGVAVITTAAFTGLHLASTDSDENISEKQTASRSSQNAKANARPTSLAEYRLRRHHRQSTSRPTKKPAERSAELAAKGESAIAEISAGLANASTLEEKQIYSDALAMIGSEEAVSQLIARALEEPDYKTRKGILSSLDALGNREGLNVLTDAFTQNNRSLLSAASSTLSRLGDATTVDALVERYRNDPNVRNQRNHITTTLAGIQDPGSARSLASLARTAPEPGLVEAAARGLSKIGTPTAVQGLRDALRIHGEQDATLAAALRDLIARVENPQGIRYLQLQEPLAQQ